MKESIHGFSSETNSDRNSGLESTGHGSTFKKGYSHITSLSGLSWASL